MIADLIASLLSVGQGMPLKARAPYNTEEGPEQGELSYPGRADVGGQSANALVFPDRLNIALIVCRVIAAGALAIHAERAVKHAPIKAQHVAQPVAHAAAGQAV